MVAGVGIWRDGGVEASAIHRTFIRSDGSAKADIDPAKAMLGRVAGGAVWLSDPAPVLAVGEGIETVLSVATAILDAGYAFAAALSAPNLAVLEIPDWVRELLILADADAAGEREALALANRAMQQELPVRIARPPSPHNDFNDVLRTPRRDAHHDDRNSEATA
jgi:Toprim domain